MNTRGCSGARWTQLIMSWHPISRLRTKQTSFNSISNKKVSAVSWLQEFIYLFDQKKFMLNMVYVSFPRVLPSETLKCTDYKVIYSSGPTMRTSLTKPGLGNAKSLCAHTKTRALGNPNHSISLKRAHLYLLFTFSFTVKSRFNDKEGVAHRSARNKWIIHWIVAPQNPR